MANEGPVGGQVEASEDEQALVEIGRVFLRGREALDQRSVAGLAVYVRVLSVLLLVLHIRVTCFTCVVAGELCGTGCDFADGGSAVVSVLSEAFGDDEVSHHQKYHEGEDKESRKSKKMPSILDDIDQPPTSIPPLSEDL